MKYVACLRMTLETARSKMVEETSHLMETLTMSNLYRVNSSELLVSKRSMKMINQKRREWTRILLRNKMKCIMNQRNNHAFEDAGYPNMWAGDLEHIHQTAVMTKENGNSLVPDICIAEEMTTQRNRKIKLDTGTYEANKTTIQCTCQSSRSTSVVCSPSMRGAVGPEPPLPP